MSKKTDNKYDNLICQFLKHLESVESVSEHTLRAYESDLQQAFEKLGSAIFEPSLYLEICREAQSKWSRLSQNSRNRKLGTLKSFTGYLYDKTILPEDLRIFLNGPKTQQKIPHFISVDEALSLIRKIESQVKLCSDPIESKILKFDFALILLLYGGGLRVSEASNLRWRDVVVEKNVLRILGKGHKERIVAISQMVMSSITALDRNGEFIWGEKAFSTRKAYDLVRLWGVRA